MNELAAKVQQTYDRDGRDKAREVLLATCLERDWTQEDLGEAFSLYRTFPTPQATGD
ncbi:hypothetical protein [Streptomyces sp. 8L]|uniref:hypothetical protein n=1 Tax=Streptomyces sp. 8L TaxID=2877242 RepID=UPI001CD2ABBC|nr:hypothetical protein [Streptomyces sp. 8L]MCA1223561.1 hypothetical protein [Streptomyces sp. 8L]